MKSFIAAGKVRYWALVISVTVHAAALGIFTVVKLSTRQAYAAPERSGLSMEMIERVVEQSLPKPKPQVKPIEPPVETSLPLVSKEVVEPEPVVEPAEAVSVAPAMSPEPIVHEVEFFGQKSIVQRICYVVDCSGSMYGQMYRVRSELKDSILNLTSQQAFTVLFFLDGQQISMTGPNRLEAATVSAKSEALKLIESIRPGGSTDAAHALEKAMQLRAVDGRTPEVIYFLTDGFNLDNNGALQFVEKIEGKRKSLAPGVILHTIGFWPQESDRKMLKVLASLTGGSFIEVN